MAYDLTLADRVRVYLMKFPKLKIEEKKMFRGLTFMVNGKMCVSVSNDNLMCRFDPSLHDKVSARVGFKTMIMRGREYIGYCYVSQEGYRTKKDFESWLSLCLTFNDKAKATKRKNK
ncbi:MAG: TfoX/Sxy family protein [Ignavibacteriota bacterium]